MKATRLNLITPVRTALKDAGISTVRLVNAVNAALGELKPKSSESKLGDGKIGPKSSGSPYKVTETEATKYEGPVNAPLLFDAWHSALAKAEKIATFDTVALPGVLSTWLEKLKAKTPEELKELEKENTLAKT